MNAFLLLTYSLLPGLGKIIGNQMPMVLNVPLLFILFYRNQKKIKWRTIDKFVLAFVIYAVFISLISLIFLPSNTIALFMGIYMYVIPICGYFFAYLIDFEELVKALKIIAVVHVLFGILIYPLNPIYPYIAGFAELFRTGVFGERMTTVSGSLGLAALMLICFTCFFFNTKTTKDIIILILSAIGLIFAQQRGAWLGAIVVLIVNVLERMKTGRLKIKESTIYRGFILLVFGGILIASGVFNVESLVDRYENQFGESAVDERQGQWIDGLNNVISYPLGTGVGQVGQVIRVSGGTTGFAPCADGDYPRVFSEVGVPGAIFYLFLFFMAGLLFFYSDFSNKAVKTGFFVFLGISMQMIGSNVTEFYFANFLYWMFVGYMLSGINIENGKISVL